MYLVHRLFGLVLLLVSFGLIAMLEQRFPIGVGASIYVGVAINATLAGAYLLQSSTVGRSSWRNVLATNLLPCSGMLGYGSLLKLCVSNLLGSLLFGLFCFVVARYMRHHDYSLESIGGWKIACSLAWIVLIGMVLYLVRQYGKKYYAGTNGLLKVSKLIAAPAIALAASIALVVADQLIVALVVAMIPIVLVFFPMAFLLLLAIATKLSGKPFRWN